MFARWSLVWLIAILLPAIAMAQPETLPPALQSPEPVPEVPASPQVYIPSTAPPFDCRPLGTWWVDTSAEFAWMPSRQNPPVVRFRPSDFFGRQIPALTIPLGGQGTPSSMVGLGIHAGRWLDENQNNALEIGALVFPGVTRTVSGIATGTYVLFPNGPDQSAPLLLQFPPPFSGFDSAFPATHSSWFTTVEANLRAGLLITDRARLDLIAGYRFAYLADELYLGNSPADEHDEFKQNRMLIENTFHGGQLGLDADYRANKWYTSGNIKLAYGALTTKSSASGVFLFPDMPVRYRSDTRGAFLPSLNFKLGFRFSDTGSVFVGYNFLYLTRVSRFGDAFEPGTGPLPNSVFWIQSVSLGLDFRF